MSGSVMPGSERETDLLYSPYGEVSYELFKKLRRAFADKSGVIAVLEDNGMSRYPVLLRPRRFGKSTFVRMLKCFYDVSFQDCYDELFAGTQIYTRNLASHNTYHVLNFDFSGVSGVKEDSLTRSFVIAVKSGIRDFQARYPDFAFSTEGAEQETPSGLIRSFTDAYKNYPAKKALYLMIDEYDNCASSMLSRDLELFNAITRAGGFLKDFYVAIKAAAADAGCVGKTFITGVSAVSLDSLTSGLNIARNVTFWDCFNAYAGFTEEELRKLIGELLDLKQIGVTANELSAIMKTQFGGYCFSLQAQSTLYNSSMCLYYLDEMRLAGEYLAPEKYPDPASDHDGSKLQQLFDLAEKELPETIIDTYLSGEPFYLPALAQNINLNKLNRYSRDQLLSMLYYLGYLTIDPVLSGSDGLMLKIPNLFMSRLFAQSILDMKLKPSEIFREQEIDVSALLASSEDLSSFARSCTGFVSSIVTNQVLSPMSERALDLVLHAKLDTTRGLVTECQKSLRVPGKGEQYADLALTVNKGRKMNAST